MKVPQNDSHDGHKQKTEANLNPGQAAKSVTHDLSGTNFNSKKFERHKKEFKRLKGSQPIRGKVSTWSLQIQ